jgi:hypothetical protein
MWQKEAENTPPDKNRPTENGARSFKLRRRWRLPRRHVSIYIRRWRRGHCAIERWYTFTDSAGGRREDADLQSKLSAGVKESSLYGIIARTATGFGIVDRRRTGERKVCPRNDTRTRNRIATKASRKWRAPALTDGIQSNPGKKLILFTKSVRLRGGSENGWVGGICLGINTNWRMYGDRLSSGDKRSQE